MTQAYNLSQLANKVNTSGELNPATGLSSQVPVANGGTGINALTANNVILGNGTLSVQFVAPGSTGNALVSNGTTWVSAVPTSSGSFIGYQIYTASGTYTKATNTPNFIIVEVVGGGGSGNNETVQGNNGNTSSFGTFVSATGGNRGTANTNGTVANGGTGSSGNLNVTGSKGSSINTTTNRKTIGGSSFLGVIGQGGYGISGAGGGKTTQDACSGGGGGYARLRILASALGTTETVTVGTGGAAVGTGSEPGYTGIVIVYEYK